MLEILQYCYEHIEECQMLISKAEGTRYANFLDELVETESKATHKYLQVLEDLGESVATDFPKIGTHHYHGNVQYILRTRAPPGAVGRSGAVSGRNAGVLYCRLDEIDGTGIVPFFSDRRLAKHNSALPHCF